jgi:integrase
MGNKLNKTIRDADIEGVTTYGLRHAMVDAMRNSGASEFIQLRLIGQSAKTVKDRVYGSGKVPQADMQAAITKALDHLGRFDDDGC